RMSPQLHRLVYGSFARMVQMRYGGLGAGVFLEGGLPGGVWVTTGGLPGILVGKTRGRLRKWGVLHGGVCASLAANHLRRRADGALALLAVGLTVMWTTWRLNTKWVVACLLLIAPMYVATRSTALWNGEPVVSLARMVNEERAESLKFRLDNEDLLAAKALQQ